MCKKKKAPLVAEPFHRLIALNLSGAAGNAGGGAGGVHRGACGACGNVSVVARLPILRPSLHPLSE
jgi:hypothetical protein